MIDRHVTEKIASRLFSKIPVSIWGKLTGTRLLLPYYHVVSDEDILHVKHLFKYKTISQFTEDVEFLCKYYLPIGLPELLNHLRNGRPLPAKAFLLTFDDGFRELSDIIAPILLHKGISATIFVNSAFTDNKQLCYLNKASLMVEEFQKGWSVRLDGRLSELLLDNKIEFSDVKSGILSVKYQQRGLLDEMANVMNLNFSEYLLSKKPYLTESQIIKLIESGFSIGAHSIDHPLYSSLTLEDQINQTIQSVKFVRDKFHLSYGAFAFPHSDHNVSREFFARIVDSGLVDVSFGTYGLMGESISNHLQRFSLEKPIDSAKNIIAFQYARKLIKLVTRTSLIVRK